MGFEALFGQKKLRHEAGESGNAQERPAITSIDLENGTVTLSGLADGAAARHRDDTAGTDRAARPGGPSTAPVERDRRRDPVE